MKTSATFDQISVMIWDVLNMKGTMNVRRKIFLLKSDSDVLKSLQDIMQYGLMNDENLLTDAIPALYKALYSFMKPKL